MTNATERPASYRSGPTRPVTFDAERQKRLYEALDSVIDHLGPTVQLDLLSILTTISTWQGSPELWQTLTRWSRTYTEIEELISQEAERAQQ